MSKPQKLAKAQELIGNLSQTLNELAELFFNDGLIETVEAPKKKRRDPNAPKPPASNYFLFTNSIRDKIEKAHPDATFSEKSKLYGIEWQKLTDEQKKPFTEQAKREREKYNKELAAYEAAHGIVHPEKKAKTEPASKPAASKPATKPAPVPKATATKAAVVPAKKPVVENSSSSSSEDSDEESSDSDSD